VPFSAAKDELLSHDRVVLAQLDEPVAITKGDRLLHRSDDTGEQHSGYQLIASSVGTRDPIIRFDLFDCPCPTWSRSLGRPAREPAWHQADVPPNARRAANRRAELRAIKRAACSSPSMAGREPPGCRGSGAGGLPSLTHATPFPRFYLANSRPRPRSAPPHPGL